MNKFALLVLASVSLFAFTGCAGSGSASSEGIVATNEEIAAAESSLLLDRVMAAQTLESGAAALLPSTTNVPGAARYRKRIYRAENREAGLALGRGNGACMVTVGTGSLQIGSEQASVERLDSGAIRVVRGNGSTIETPIPSATGEIESFTVDGREWQATFSDNELEPLVTLKNMNSGMILQITELDDGNLTLVRDSSEVFRGRWSEDGSLDLSDSKGKRYRYRYGKNI